MHEKNPGQPSVENEEMPESLLDPCLFCEKGIAMFVKCQEMKFCADYRKCEDGHYTSVVCSFQRGGCGASTGFFPTPQEAADAWNRRPCKITMDGTTIALGSVTVNSIREKIERSILYGQEGV